MMPEIGDVVEIHAVDWAFEDMQLSATAPFDIVRATVYGQVLRVTDEFVTVVQQVFDNGDVRCVLSMPWATISKVVVFKRGE